MIDEREAVVHVVDDDESARESLAFLLEAADFEVVSHASALALLEALPLDGAGCVITDMRMPDMTGLELVRELNAPAAACPSSVITGHGDIPWRSRPCGPGSPTSSRSRSARAG